jgi:hypothetical protein
MMVAIPSPAFMGSMMKPPVLIVACRLPDDFPMGNQNPSG